MPGGKLSACPVEAELFAGKLETTPDQIGVGTGALHTLSPGGIVILAAENLNPYDTRLNDRDRTLMTQVLQHIEQILRDGAAKKRLPAAKVPAYARMLQGALKAVVLWHVEEGDAFAQDADLVVDTFLHGVRP